jgi:hypothetical protein
MTFNAFLKSNTYHPWLFRCNLQFCFQLDFQEAPMSVDPPWNSQCIYAVNLWFDLATQIPTFLSTNPSGGHWHLMIEMLVHGFHYIHLIYFNDTEARKSFTAHLFEDSKGGDYRHPLSVLHSDMFPIFFIHILCLGLQLILQVSLFLLSTDISVSYWWPSSALV